MEKEEQSISHTRNDINKIKANIDEIDKGKKTFKDQIFFYKKEIEKIKLQ